MAELFISLAVFMLLFGISTGMVCLMNYFFPSTKSYLPDGWGQWMSFRFVTYYFLIASVLLFLGKS